MLTAITNHLNNHFIRTVERGEFKIEDGGLTVSQNYPQGQYILLVGSLFNDGVYQAAQVEKLPRGCRITPGDLQDETFTGAVCGLAIPKSFLALVEDVKKYVLQNQGENAALTSESFSGYSYQKATNAKGQVVGWPDVFSGRLNDYRRMFPERVL